MIFKLIYFTLTILVHPFLFFILKIRVKNKKEHNSRYKEKLGFPTISPKNNLIWFHVASLGEIKSIYSIVKHYQKNPNINILITSVTLSSSIFFEERLKEKNIFHQFAPLDTPFIVKKFLNYWKPKLCILVESEIWPNLINQTSKQTKIILLNARISKKSFKRWIILKSFFKNLISKFNLILVQNEETKKYLSTLNINKTIFIGNLKYINQKNINPGKLIIRDIDNSWVAMSIHFEEIDFIIKTHLKLKNKINNLKTYLIPRHLNKIDQIINKLNKVNLTYQKSSQNFTIDTSKDIILIDQFGIADDIFNKIKIVFMGGSIIDHGGQNPIEPLKYNCKILTGKNIDNFKEIYQDLAKHKFVKIIEDKNNLSLELLNLLKLKNENENFNINTYFKNFTETIFTKTINQLDKFFSK